ncbi:MAG: DUF1415 domain-containing protein [Marinobacterium sp.]|nr:DUF1415 domain-containing protein [Marinobacterium sp.]
MGVNQTSVVVEQTRNWVESVVVGLNLCPFAAPVIRQQSIRYAESAARDDESVIQDFLLELDRLQQTDEAELSTTLVIYPAVFEDFAHYLDLLSIMEDLLEQTGLDGIFQLASFHPDYLFDGVPEDDRSHWTNRAPYPTVHIIREGEMSRVLMHYKNPEQIPERNMGVLRNLSDEKLAELYPHLMK